MHGRLKHRFRDLSRQRDQPAMLSAVAQPRHRDERRDDRANRSAKVQRALAMAINADISADDAYPPVLQALAHAGLPVRPVHFMPVWVPFLFGTFFGIGLASITLLVADALGGVNGPLAAVATHGLTGAIGGAAICGAVLAGVVRLQARRARLPSWSEV
jgi:hypothetical protein